MSAPPRERAMDDWREHGGFLRRLARRLVSDSYAADDLVQDAHLAGLKGGPEQPLARRRWYARVVRNLSRNLRRGGRRRAERERLAARPEAVQPEDVRARLEVQARIVSLVGELEDPYRTTVYMRFYEDLPPREIAARQGVPVATVKTRLQRALGKLRTRLDREFGRERRGWCAVLVPLASVSHPPVPMTPVLLGGAAVKTAVVMGMAAIAVVLGVLYLPSDVEPASPPAQRGGLDREPEALPAVVSAPAPVQSLREPLASELEVETELAGDWIVLGRVLDSSGSPVASARIAAEMEPSREGVATTADGDGHYRLAVNLPEGISRWASVALHAKASAEGFASQERRAGDLRRGEGDRELVFDFILSPRRHARGVIVDAGGAAAEGATVALIDTQGTIQSSGQTGTGGEYTLALGSEGPVWLVAGSGAKGSILTGPHDVSVGPDLELGTLALQAHGTLEGTLRSPDGRAFADAVVRARLLEADPGVGTLLDSWFEAMSVEDRDAVLMPQAFAGNTVGETRTDGEGHFRLDGLAPGRYELEFPGLARPPEIARAGPYHTGEHAQVAVQAYRVHVRVRDHRGLSVPGADLTARSGNGATVSSARGLDGEGILQVTPGSWVVTASLEGARPAEQTLEVIEGHSEYEVQLILDFEPETGELQILVTDEGGREIETFAVNLWLRDASMMVADFNGLEPDENGVLPSIPTGDYMVRATFPAQPGRSLEPGRPQRLGDYFSVDTHAAIVAGERSVLRLKARRGGRLHLQIEPRAADRVPVSVTLEDVVSGKSRRVSNLIRQVSEEQSRNVPVGLGAIGFSNLVEAGSYVVRARAEGYRDFEQTVVVKPGEVTEIRIPMELRN